MDVQTIIDQMTTFFTEYSLNILGSLLIFFIGKWVAKKMVSLLGKLLAKQQVDETLIRFLDNIVYYALMVVVLMAAADSLGVDTTSFLAIFGAAGLAVGLALKDSLGNFASGVMLVFFRPFKILKQNPLCKQLSVHLFLFAQSNNSIIRASNLVIVTSLMFLF